MPRNKTDYRSGTLLACVLLTCLPSASANNNLFLPGDAFFPTELTLADIESLQVTRAEKRQFKYSSLGGYEGAFCGYAGYRNAIIPGVDDAFIKNLADLYTELRRHGGRELLEVIEEDGSKKLVEMNGLRVLFYPKDFEFPRNQLGLRYNEKWVAEAMKFGHRRASLRMCCLVPDASAVERSWRDATSVPALEVVLPEVELRPVPITREPVVVQGPVQAIVIGSYQLTDLFRYGHDEYLQIHAVDSDGIVEIEHIDGRWERYEPE